MESLENFTEVITQLLKEVDKKAVECAYSFLQFSRLFQDDIYVCGNGGSFSTALHFSQDLYNRCNLRAFCLGQNISTLTAIANDVDYSEVFVNDYLKMRRISSIDNIFLLSCSGTSKNIVKMFEFADNKNVVLITGNKVKEFPKNVRVIRINSDVPELIESVTSALLHYYVLRLAQ